MSNRTSGKQRRVEVAFAAVVIVAVAALVVHGRQMSLTGPQLASSDENVPPALTARGDTPSGDLALMLAANGGSQWAFKGKPPTSSAQLCRKHPHAAL